MTLTLYCFVSLVHTGGLRQAEATMSNPSIIGPSTLHCPATAWVMQARLVGTVLSVVAESFHRLGSFKCILITVIFSYSSFVMSYSIIMLIDSTVLGYFLLAFSKTSYFSNVVPRHHQYTRSPNDGKCCTNSGILSGFQQLQGYITS